jgi:hypothetical protein
VRSSFALGTFCKAAGTAQLHARGGGARAKLTDQLLAFSRKQRLNPKRST